MHAEQECNERWLPVVGHEGYYEVSDLGRVRSVDRVMVNKAGVRRNVKGRIRATPAWGGGYLCVGLYGPWGHKMSQVHRLVLAAFVGPRPDGLVIRHLNGDPADNRLTNIAYGTPAENAQDSLRHGTHHEVNKTHCPSGHEYSGDNLIVAASNGWRRCRIGVNAVNTRLREARRAAA